MFIQHQVYGSRILNVNYSVATNRAYGSHILNVNIRLRVDFLSVIRYNSTVRYPHGGMLMNTSRSSRRDFLKTTAATAAGAALASAAPTTSRSHRKFVIGMMGTGGRGTWLLTEELGIRLHRDAQAAERRYRRGPPFHAAMPDGQHRPPRRQPAARVRRQDGILPERS